jgi:hypothetical protein
VSSELGGKRVCAIVSLPAVLFLLLLTSTIAGIGQTKLDEFHDDIETMNERCAGGVSREARESERFRRDRQPSNGGVAIWTGASFRVCVFVRSAGGCQSLQIFTSTVEAVPLLHQSWFVPGGLGIPTHLGRTNRNVEEGFSAPMIHQVFC